MLHRLLYAPWDEAPEAMAFELSYRAAVASIRQRLSIVLPRLQEALERPASLEPTYWDACIDLYLQVPALVNVALNYKVCVEQGLPLHPTYYFEISAKNRAQVGHPPEALAEAQAFFLRAINTAVAIFRLEPDCAARLEALEACIPGPMADFIYTSTRDKYTWRASEPAKIADLVAAFRPKVAPIALVGAAHGAIMAGLLLAAMVDLPVYFIRFSLFKRKDTDPVIAPSDLAVLGAWRRGPVLLFDEDVAKGTTLGKFTTYLKPFFEEAYSAGVLRHRHADFRPDFVGRTWDD